MSIDDPGGSFSVLVDEPRQRSAVPPIVAGAVLLVLLVGAQIGFAAAGSETATAAADGNQLTAASAVVAPSADAATGLPEPAAAPTGRPVPEATVPEAAVPEAAGTSAPAAPVDPRVAELQQQLDAAGPVTFDPVTGEPTDDRTAVLNAVAAAVLAAGDLPVAVVGHAAPSGDPAAEQAEALENAESVWLSLRLRMVPSQLLVTESAGADGADGTPGAGRVTFRALPAS